MADFHYRVLRGREEVGEACTVFWRSMVGLPPLGDIDPFDGVEAGRFVGAFDGDRIVGCTDSYQSWLTVPGGARVPHAAVTHVGVLPTHTRRGIMRDLLVGQLHDFARRGEVLASLRASEAVLYERFGYGIATAAASMRVMRARARLREHVPAGGRITLIEDPDPAALLAGIYEQAAWTGSIKRPDGWWLLTRLALKAEPIQPYYAVHGERGAEDGFVQYRPTKPYEWLHSDERVVQVEDFVAASTAAYHGLLRHLLSLDLVDVLEFTTLPVDDPLPTMFTDARAVRDLTVHDETWLRLVDVEAALNARSYRGGGAVVIEVTDAILGHNNARFEVSAKGAVRTGRPAGLRVDVAGLACAYLGGTRWWQLARGARAVELAPDATATADELFATPSLPYSGTGF